MSSVSGGEKRFPLPVRIYYEDTDAGGVVYYANYLRYMERARNDWLRSLGYDLSRLVEEQGLVFVVRRASLEYLAPGRLDDLLTVTAAIEKIGRASLDFRQQVLRAGDLLVDARLTLVTVDAGSLKPCRLPDFLTNDIKRWIQQ